MVDKRREKRSEARDFELTVGVAKTDQPMPGIQGSTETGPKSGAVAFIAAVMHRLDISGVVDG
jgi:hypothetical protein